MANYSIGGNFTWTGSTTFSGSVSMPALTNVSTADVVFYNTSTHLLTYSTVSSIISSAWLLAGNAGTGGAALFGTKDAFGWTMISNNTPFFNVDSVQNANFSPANFSVSAQAGIALSGQTGSSFTDVVHVSIDSPSLLIGSSTCTAMTLGNSAAVTSVASHGYTLQNSSGNVILNANGASASFVINAIGTSSVVSITADQLCELTSNNGSVELQTLVGDVVVSAANNFSGSAGGMNWNIGNNGVTITCLANIDLESNTGLTLNTSIATTIQIGQTASASALTFVRGNYLELDAGSAGFLLSATGNITQNTSGTFNVTSTGLASLTATGGFSLTSSAFFVVESALFEFNGGAYPTPNFEILNTATIFIGADATATQISIGTAATNLIFIGNLPSATTSNLIYWNTSTHQFSQGAAPIPNLSWNTVAGTSQAMVAGNSYVNSNAALTTFTLPATATVGQEFQVQGNGSGGWSIVYNSGQNIQIGNTSSTVTSGSVSSTNRYDVVRLVCTVANTNFNSEFLVGNLTIV